uniref:Major capsid protein N-terminal domain-containing protein n=1 Tax=viral metagenome TaxID=1070528 RepID=A0A6C0E5E7_9ZZZZ
MTSGGLMQLVAYGAQDVYLTANPQVTFFKQLYRRHSNFAMEAIEQTFNGVGNFGKRVQSTISRNGDLITKVYVQVTLPAIDNTIFNNVTTPNQVNAFSWVPYLGQYLIDNVYVEIGGQQIDKHYGEWLHIWNELTLPVGKELAYLNMVNAYGGVALSPQAACRSCQTELTPDDVRALACVNPMIAANGTDCVFANTTAFSPTLTTNTLYESGSEPQAVGLTGCIPEQTLYIPLEFWFNRHAGLALPLIALQYHEVKINVEFTQLQYLVNLNCGSAANNSAVLNNVAQKGMVACSLYVDYVYLDTEERRRFAQVAHEYLIEQLQFTGTESVTSTSNKIQLSFNHPCKEIVWVVQNPSYLDCLSTTNSPWRYTDSNLGNPTAVAKIQLNGQDRFTEREGSYFNFVQPYQHHTSTPSTGINVYSFALKPEELQPSGSCNFSRIDNAVLNLTLTPATFATNADVFPKLSVASDSSDVAKYPSQPSANVNVYATNYNVLRIMSGMGGLAYSN